MPQLRPYQAKLKQDVYTAWESHANVLAVLPTGGGKTVILSDIVSEHKGVSCVIAHRQELVGQISKALNAAKVPHRIMAPLSLIRQITADHLIEHGYSMYNTGALCGVAGVNTLTSKSRAREYEKFCQQCTLWIMDEAHHCLVSNVWGRAVAMFPNAKGLGVTATPCRADGAGLGRHADGVFDVMVEGPSMAWLIENGYLTRYRVFCPPGFDRAALKDAISATTGDYNTRSAAVVAAVDGIVGDVVKSYLKHAKGLRGVTFTVDVETATHLAAAYVAAGVPAEVVSAQTPEAERSNAIRKFNRGQLLQLVNVDLFGEGFDVPAIEVVSFARPTESYSLYSQQFGRALRILDGKTHAIILDHVGNFTRHLPPDMRPWAWTLDAADKKSRSGASDTIPLKVCTGCTQPYEAYLKACPYCGTVPEPPSRRDVKTVEGDLHELDADVLDAMRAEVLRVNMPVGDYDLQLRRNHVDHKFIPHKVKQFAEKQEPRLAALEGLRLAIDYWAGHQMAARGLDESTAYRLFFYRFGVDVLGAQTQSAAQMEQMTIKLWGDM